MWHWMRGKTPDVCILMLLNVYGLFWKKVVITLRWNLTGCKRTSIFYHLYFQMVMNKRSKCFEILKFRSHVLSTVALF